MIKRFVTARRAVLHNAGNPWVMSVAGTAGMRVGVLILGLGSTVALARGLGPGGRGVYALAMSLAAIGSVAVDLGFRSANTYFVSRQPQALAVLVSNTVALALALATLGSGLVGLGWVLGLNATPLSLPLLLLTVAWLPVSIIFLQLQPLLLTQGRIRQFNLAEGGWQLTSVVLVMSLWAFGRLTPVSAFAVVLASFAGGAVFVMVKLKPFGSFGWRPSITTWRRTLPYAARSWASDLTAVSLVRIDVFVVAAVLDIGSVGLYAVAVTVCEAIRVIPGTIAALLLPRLAKMTDCDQRWAITRRVLVATGVVMVCLCASAAAVASLAIGMIFGPEYQGATAALFWLLPGVVLGGVNSILVQHFLSDGMPGPVVVAQATAVLVSAGLTLTLSRSMGLAGAGLASTLASGSLLAMTLGYAARWRHAPRDRGGTSHHLAEPAPVVVT